MSNYRAAKCIELHDSNIALTTSDDTYVDTCLTGRTEDSDKPAFSIKLCDIKMLAEMFNIETREIVNVPKLSTQPITQTGERSEIDFVEFPIHKVHHDYSDKAHSKGENITKLECELISDRLINIKTTATFDDDPEPYIEEITYCGSFTIWWQKS